MFERPLVFVVAFGVVCAGPLWPPSAQGVPENLGGFDSSWQVLGGAFAAHAAAGGRTVAKRGSGGVLHVSLPGTFTVPQQFSALLKASVDMGVDTIGLDYGWGPSPDSKRSAQCGLSSSCQTCQDNYHELVGFGAGEDLITGQYPVFGDNQTETLKFTHFFASGVSFLPTFKLGADVDIASPLSSIAREYIGSIKDKYNVEALLAKVLQELGWNEYLLATGSPNWSKIVVSGHSQGASHAAYIAYQRNVLGALLFSGPQDVCGAGGATWVAKASQQDKENIMGCYAVDEPGKPAIELNMDFMTELTRINMTGRTMSHGTGTWCAPPAHCATAVDDQLADEAIERCFGKLQRFAVAKRGSGGQCIRIPFSVAKQFKAKPCH